MGIGLGSLMKVARGGLGPDELAEVLGAMGMDVSFREVPAARESFEPLGRMASLPDAKLVELKGTTKDGASIYALIVMNHGR